MDTPAFSAASDAGLILNTLRSHEYGHDATIIGTVGERNGGGLILQTIIGGSRIVDLPLGELVPRIC